MAVYWDALLPNKPSIISVTAIKQTLYSSDPIRSAFQMIIQDRYTNKLIGTCVSSNELKLIVDLVYEHGIEGMMKAVSNTAEYGGRTRGKWIIDEKARETMKKMLEEVKSGKFAKEWVDEAKSSIPNLRKMREEGNKHLVERVGKDLRKWAGIEK